MDADVDPGERVRRFLDTEPVVWLSTVRPDGLPHVVPVWFWWDGEVITLFSKPHAVKVRALRASGRAMLALGDAEKDFDIGMLEARADVADEPVAPPDAFYAKYRRKLRAAGLDRATFEATYTQPIRLTPTRYLPWHGRSEPESIRRLRRGSEHGLLGRLRGIFRALRLLPA